MQSTRAQIVQAAPPLIALALAGATSGALQSWIGGRGWPLLWALYGALIGPFAVLYLVGLAAAGSRFPGLVGRGRPGDSVTEHAELGPPWDSELDR